MNYYDQQIKDITTTQIEYASDIYELKEKQKRLETKINNILAINIIVICLILIVVLHIYNTR
jgi:hypothetical protein